MIRKTVELSELIRAIQPFLHLTTLGAGGIVVKINKYSPTAQVVNQMCDKISALAGLTVEKRVNEKQETDCKI